MSTPPTNIYSRVRNLPPIHIDRGHYPKPDESSDSDLGSNEFIAPTQKTEASRLKYTDDNSDSLIINNDSTFNFGPEKLIIETRPEESIDKRVTKSKLKKVNSILNSLKDLALVLLTQLVAEENRSPSIIINKIQELLSKVLGEVSIKQAAKPEITSQDPEKAGGRPVMPNNVGHELPPVSNAYAPENNSYGNQADMHATPGTHPGKTAKYQLPDAISGSHAAHHGSADNNILQFEIKNKASDDIEEDLEEDIEEDIEHLETKIIDGTSKDAPRSSGTDRKTDY